jgi:hypothetical protein
VRHWYDIEFIDDGHTIDLVSIGIVAEDHREYYAVSSAFDVDKFCSRQWLMDNVAPSLPLVQSAGGWYLDMDNAAVRRPSVIAQEVSEFLRVGLDDGAQAELWSWYPAYDHVVLAQLFGPMADLPKHIPRRTNDIEQEAERQQITGLLPEPPLGLHNALIDAWYHRQLWQFVTNRPDLG